jgi:SPP1 gp7 family putative phage head morphogenesis protein
VSSLQTDQLAQVQIATLMGRAASLNERRSVMGLEPVDKKDDPDGKADEIPELVQPSMAELLAGSGGANDNTEKDPTKAPPKEEDPEEETPTKKIARLMGVTVRVLERKIQAAALQDAFRDEAVPLYVVHSERRLRADADRIVEIVMHSLLDEREAKAIQTKSRGKDKVMSAVTRYLNEDGRKGWTRALQPLNETSALRSGAAVASDMNLNFSLLHGNLLTYARKQTGKMITDVNKTTQSLVSDIIQGGIDANKSTKEIARVISEATGFSSSRANLIARTETTKVFSGAPTESLSILAQTGRRSFTKTWSGVLDDKERDEHLEMEGETVDIDAEFSNGLQYPSEPNCRCSLLYAETTEE